MLQEKKQTEPNKILQEIANNIKYSSDIGGSIDATVRLADDDFNMLSYALHEIGDQLKRIADHLEKK